MAKATISHTRSADELRALAARFAETRPKSSRLFLFTGPLGAGKTTFIQGFAEGLGVRMAVSSPTFTLIHEHSMPHGKQKLVHIDLYRIKQENELAPVQMSDYLENPDTLVCVEWADKFQKLWKEYSPTYINIALGEGKNERRTRIVLP